MNAPEFLALLLRTGLVLALALGADALLRRAAAVRSFLLRAALVAAVVAACVPWLFPAQIHPVVALSGPPIEAMPAPILTPKPTAMPVAASQPTTVAKASVPLAASAPVAAPSHISPPSPNSPPHPLTDLSLLWALGAAATGAYWLVAHVAVLTLRRRGLPVDGVAKQILDQVCREQGVAMPILRQVPALGSPLACGILRPCILLPQKMVHRGDRTELTAALAHEVAHLARRDVPWTYATRVVQSLLWFQPLVWGLHRRMVAASEELCDLQAVQGGLKRETYADCLLSLAEAASRPRIESALGSQMATKRSSLAARIEALLDARRARVTRLSKRTRTLVGTGVAALAVAGGIFVAVPAAARQEPSSANVAAIPGTEKEGRAQFEALIARYRNFKTISLTAVAEGAGDSYRMNVRFQRPNLLMAEVWRRDGTANPRRAIIVDGKNVLVYDEREPGEIVATPMISPSLQEVLRSQARLSTPLALNLIASQNAAAGLSPWQSKKTRFALAGKDRRSIVLSVVTQSGEGTLTLDLDDAGLLREESLRYEAADGKTHTATTLYSNIRLDESLPADTFRFKARKGVRIVAAFQPVLHQEPAALALAKRIEGAAKNLDGIAFEVERTERITRKGVPDSATKIVRKIEYRKDGAARIEEDYPRHWGDVLLVSNGKELIARSEKSRRKVVRQTLASDPPSRLYQLLTSAEYRVPQTAYGQFIEMAYLGGAEAYNLRRSSMRIVPRATVGGSSLDVLILESRFQKINGAPAPGGLTERVFVDSRGFIQRYEKTSRFGPTQTNEEVAVVRNLRINPYLPDSRFKIEVPAGYAVLKSGNVGLEETYRSYRPTHQLSPGEIPPSTPFRTLDGRTTNLTAYKGKVVLVQGWTPGVTNRERDLPRAQALHRKYAKDGLVVIAMGFYQNNQDVGMRKFLKQKGYTFINVLDGPGLQGSLAKAWNIRSFPFSVVIGRNGVVKSLNDMDEQLDQSVKLALSER